MNSWVLGVAAPGARSTAGEGRGGGASSAQHQPYLALEVALGGGAEWVEGAAPADRKYSWVQLASLTHHLL